MNCKQEVTEIVSKVRCLHCPEFHQVGSGVPLIAVARASVAVTAETTATGFKQTTCELTASIDYRAKGWTALNENRGVWNHTLYPYFT